MAFDIGLNFRRTDTYVADPAGTTCVLGDSYPTTRGGATFGWLNAVGNNTRDRSTTVDPRLAGIHFLGNGDSVKKKFRLDLPAPGAVDIYCAIGDAGSGNQGYLEIFDGVTSLGILVAKKTLGTVGTFYDATDTGLAAADWPSLNAKTTLTFATTTLIVAVTPGDSTGLNYVIAHLRAVQTASGVTLTGDNAAQANASSSPGITQTHFLAGGASAQSNASGSGAIALGAINTLIGAASTQGNAGITGAITQTHVLTVFGTTQVGTSSAIAITQVQTLAGENATQGNIGGTIAISILVPFAGSPSTQANLSSAGQITRTQTLGGAPSTQANLAGTGAISDGIMVEAALTTGIAETTRIKKPGIPAGTPEWLKTMLEILTGRRGNRVEAPRFQTLTFSATPTKAECEALYGYTNTVRDSLEQLINRMDG